MSKCEEGQCIVGISPKIGMPIVRKRDESQLIKDGGVMFLFCPICGDGVNDDYYDNKLKEAGYGN